MRDGEGQRLHLKSKLLVGAAGIAAAAMNAPAFAADATTSSTSAAPASPPPAAPAATPASTAPAMTPIDPPKWLPYVDIGGGAGSGFAIGRANAFVPVWQDLDSLLFVRLGASTRTRYSGNFNFGLGYRAKIDSDWILGVFGGFDSSQSDQNHTFNQFSFGAEAMSADWDIRANAYLAGTGTKAGNKFELYLHDTTIGILQAQESAFSGFDGEVGYRVFSTDNTDVRVFAGGYSFHHSDPNVGPFTVGTSYKDVAGPRLRAEVNVFDLDALGQQSRLSFEGEVSHDSVHHTQEYVGATLRIALGDLSGSGAQALDDLDRRMVDPVRRQDNVLTQWKFNKPEPVIIYNSQIRSQPTNTVYYADQQSSTGKGSYTDPTTVQDATSRAAKNQFIVLTDQGGGTIDVTGTTVKSGETLAGSGVFKVKGANSGTIFTHDFAPGSGHVALTATGGNALTVESDTALGGFSISGAFTNAIYGHNVDDVVISGVTINGGGVGQNGIVFNQTNTSGTSSIAISDATIKGVTNDGIDLGVTSSTGGTSTTNLVANNVSIDAGHYGVSLTSSSSGGSDATVYVGIHNSSITGGTMGVNTSASTSGGSLTQTVVIDPTVIHGGVYIHGNATTGTLTQNFTDTDGTIRGAFSVYGEAHGGTLVQNVDAAHITVGTSHLPLSIGAYADAGSVVQNVNLSHVTANGSAGDDVAITADAYGDSSITQTVSLTHVRASNAGYNGVYLEAGASYGATAIQSVSLTDLTASNNGGSGVFASVGSYSKAADVPSVAAQYLTINGATLNGNAADGVGAIATADTNAVTRQDVNVLNATIESNDVGITVNGLALGGASVQQNIYFAYDSVTGNTNDGIDLQTSAVSGNGFAAQYGTIYDVDVSNNGVDGIFLSANAYQADAEQGFYMVGITADHEGRDGIEAVATAAGYTAGSYKTYPAHVEQDFYVVYSDLSYNGRNGLEIFDTASDRAQIDQLAFVYGSHMDNNSEYGFYVQAYADGPAGATYANGEKTFLNTNLYVEGSTADHNALSGIYIYTAATGAGVLTEHLTVAGTEANYNGGYGLSDVAYANGYLSENIHYVTLASSAFDHNSADGAELIAAQYNGPGPYGVSIQFDTISGSDFSYNGGNGLFFGLFANGYNGRAEAYATISGSSFTHNAFDGLDSFAYAGNGGYLPGYSCFAIQGTVGYCAVVREALDIDSSRFANNGYSGIYLGSVAYDYGAIYSQGGRAPAPSLYINNSTITKNAQAGVTLFNYLYGGSYQFQYIVINNSTITKNGTNGGYVLVPRVSVPLLEGGISITNALKYYSGQEQFVYVEHSNVSNNKGFGIDLFTEGFKYLGETNVLVVENSKVNANYGGVLDEMVGILNYGNSNQIFYSANSHFDDNIGGGVGFASKYSGVGVAEFSLQELVLGTTYQYFGSVGSTFSGNAYVGALAEDVAKYIVGGATQTMASSGDTFNNNGYDGLDVGMASKYSSPPLASSYQNVFISGDTMSGNGRSGLYAGVRLDDQSIVYQTLHVADTTMDDNGYTGFYSAAYVVDGSFLLQNIAIYSYHATASASGNEVGISVAARVAGSSTMLSYNYVTGVTLSNNTQDGVSTYLSGLSGSTTFNKYHFDGNTLSGNATGISLYADQGGSAQISYLTDNTITGSNVGIEAIAANSAYQYIQYYTGGNALSGNTTPHNFSTVGGGTQTVN